jgi:hypothetical protein
MPLEGHNTEAQLSSHSEVRIKMANEILKIKRNKFFSELDQLKEIQNLVESYNGNSNFHYMLRLKIAVRRGWF